MGKWQDGTALVVVDVQMGFNDTGYWGERNNPNCELNIGDLLEAWRKQDWPIVFVKHNSTDDRSPLNKNHPGNEDGADTAEGNLMEPHRHKYVHNRRAPEHQRHDINRFASR